MKVQFIQTINIVDEIFIVMKRDHYFIMLNINILFQYNTLTIHITFHILLSRSGKLFYMLTDCIQ